MVTHISDGCEDQSVYSIDTLPRVQICNSDESVYTIDTLFLAVSAHCLKGGRLPLRLIDSAFRWWRGSKCL